MQTVKALVLTATFSLFVAVTGVTQGEDVPVVDVNQDIAQYQGQASPATTASAPGPVPATDSAPAEKPLISTDSIAQNPGNLQSAAMVDQDLSSMPLPERVARLEQQMHNLTRMNLPQQISDLQQQLQQINGQLTKQAHDLQVLSDQQRNFYQDLNQRITRLSQSSPAISTAQASKPTGSTSVASNPDAQSYQNAFALLAKKQYDPAKRAFWRYLSQYKKGYYAASAHYWLGEIHLMEKKIDLAAEQFNIVINQFSKSAKVAEAKLKLAIIHAAQGKGSQARSELRKIKQQYPGSTAAQLASLQLQQMAAQQHSTP